MNIPGSAIKSTGGTMLNPQRAPMGGSHQILSTGKQQAQRNLDISPSQMLQAKTGGGSQLVSSFMGASQTQSSLYVMD